MSDQPKEVDTQEDKRSALVDKAKSLGIKQASNMKIETLEKRISEAEKAFADADREVNPGPQESNIDDSLGLDVVLSEQSKRFIDSLEFDFNWLASIANQYNFDRLEYVHKFRAFRCYTDGVHIDWINLNELSLLNGGRNVCQILSHYQPLPKHRQIIDMPWRQ